jgi:hypothetical protein
MMSAFTISLVIALFVIAALSFGFLLQTPTIESGKENEPRCFHCGSANFLLHVFGATTWCPLCNTNQPKVAHGHGRCSACGAEWKRFLSNWEVRAWGMFQESAHAVNQDVGKPGLSAEQGDASAHGTMSAPAGSTDSLIDGEAGAASTTQKVSRNG